MPDKTVPSICLNFYSRIIGRMERIMKNEKKSSEYVRAELTLINLSSEDIIQTSNIDPDGWVPVTRSSNSYGSWD